MFERFSHPNPFRGGHHHLHPRPSQVYISKNRVRKLQKKQSQTLRAGVVRLISSDWFLGRILQGASVMYGVPYVPPPGSLGAKMLEKRAEKEAKKKKKDKPDAPTGNVLASAVKEESPWEIQQKLVEKLSRWTSSQIQDILKLFEGPELRVKMAALRVTSEKLMRELLMDMGMEECGMTVTKLLEFCRADERVELRDGDELQKKAGRGVSFVVRRRPEA